MSRQRQLNALLFELQASGSALDRARVLARAWRSVRDLSTSDRRLLARYAAFDGAEELIENLARRGGGPAPALLLRALSSVGQDDDGAVSRLVASLRRGAPLSELAVDAVDAAAELVAEPAPQDEVPEGHSAVAGAREGDAGEGAAVAAAMAALSEVGRQGNEGAEKRAEQRRGHSAAPVPKTAAVEVASAPTRYGSTAMRPEIGDRPPAVSTTTLMPGWDELQRGGVPAAAVIAAGGFGRQDSEPSEISAAAGPREEAESVLERFGRLRFVLASRPEASELRGLALSFPDGWQRRRAVSRLLESEALRSVSDGLELVATLERERDRLWCLRVLVERHPASAASLAELVDGVASPVARRRLSAMASSA